VWPEARHKINVMQSIDDYSEALGNNPAMVVSDSEAEALAQAEREAAQQAAQMAQAAEMANMAKTASETSIDENNVLGATMDRAGAL